jgi:hypothetical protein
MVLAMKKYLSMAAMLFISSCAISHTVNSENFKKRWEESLNDSAVSWWYVGESASAYYLTEKWIFNHYSYEVPKTMITLVGIKEMEPCKSCEGINLKVGNVKFNQAGL